MTMLTHSKAGFRNGNRRRSRCCTRFGNPGSHRIGIFAFNLDFDVVFIILITITGDITARPVFANNHVARGVWYMLA